MRRFILTLTAYGLVACADLAGCANDNKGADCAKLKVDDSTINEILETICGKSTSIVGCSIRAQCAKNTTLSQEYCAPFSLWADICNLDYAKDDKCKTYTGLCGSGTVVQQCGQFKPLPNIVSTSSVAKSLGTICSDPNHFMQACNDTKCPKTKGPNGLYDCDMLADLREVCLTMDTMGECFGWKSMCTASQNFAPACQHMEIGSPNPPSTTSGGGAYG
ncbi:hypothetical protein L0F63_005451, partial [Massospora cicadina]